MTTGDAIWNERPRSTMLKPEYDTQEAVPAHMREHYALNAGSKKWTLQVEQHEAEKIVPKFRSDLPTAKAKADYIRQNGVEAYLKLDESEDARVVDKAQLRSDHARQQFIAKNGLAAFHALNDSRVR